ncbi:MULTISPECIES: hypothetical protein [Burkholderiaceae]|jgi:uncharacterized protein (DUF1778 family)|uniref:Gp11 n=2 Tax=Burkholderia cepacia complex TaxID=87882 RepID=A0A1B4MYU6_9BURK|nr:MULTISPECIES: hypothetical protein [Burkholderiaceae]AIO49612.1 putative gp11 [Burkholderia cepacia]AIO74436.1 putative gp11 [Burkholderia multivorans]AIO75536.1 putative gp11 [Burkholderia multivorans]AJY18868.1 putative gp11 [Burkholderia multivorans ATCC BAA-247]AOJ94588.1 hypothetical protein WK22_16195 [Burkholderia multivorans]
MYPDPKRVRDNRLMLRFDDYEYALITALANYQGEQTATLIRQMVLREAAEALLPSSNVARDQAR